MEICFLGTASGLPSMKRHSTSLLLSRIDQNDEVHRILVDTGEGVSRQLIKYFGIPKPNFDEIEGIVITHTHSDHFTGIFLLIQMFHVLKRTKPLTIMMSHDAIAIFKEMLKLTLMYNGKRGFDIEIIPIEKQKPQDLHGFNITPFPTTHYKGYANDMEIHGHKELIAYSLRIELDSKAMVFSGDIAELNDIHEPLNEKITDILIIEGMHYDIDDLPVFLDNYTIGAVYLTHLIDEPEDFKAPPGIHIAQELKSLKLQPE